MVKRRILSEEVKFGFDKWQLTNTARGTLDRLSSRIAGIKYYSIVVIGHTDSIGSQRYNLSLGLKRAQAVGVYLAQKEEIDPERISTITFGEGIPISNNHSKEGRAKNRRVEIVVFEATLG